MDFKELNEHIPYVVGKKTHVVSMSPYPKVHLAMPGRHQKDTEIPGGDFVVMVTDTRMGWKKHQFTHDDIFLNIERKQTDSIFKLDQLMQAYAEVVFGKDPDSLDVSPGAVGVDNITFLRAVQCLAVAEHRRYAKYEPRGGGRYLPARFASGIVEGLWTAADCKRVQRLGRPGLEMLESQFGKPTPLKELTGK